MPILRRFGFAAWRQEDGTAFLWRLQPNPSDPMYYFLETSADLQETVIPRPE